MFHSSNNKNNNQNQSASSPTPTVVKQSYMSITTKKSNSFENTLTSNNGAGKNSEFKSYLIEKLINDNNNNGHSSPKLFNRIEIQPSRSDFILSLNQFSSSNNSNNNASYIQKSDSKGDLASEAGTYTVDEGADVSKSKNGKELINDIANQADLEDDLKQIENDANNTNVRQSANTNIDLISARAAIDETFGVKYQKKKSPQTTRLRNVTYSLKDVIQSNNNNNKDLTEQTATNLPPNSSFSESPSSSLSSISDTNNNVSKIKKTTTYNIINNGETELNTNQDDEVQTQVTNKTVNTELLLGDTEKLMEQLKRSRQDKKEKLKHKYILNKQQQQQQQNHQSSSSTSSSSTNVSIDNNTKNNKINNKLNSSWIIPTDKNSIEIENDGVFINTTRATVNSEEATTNSNPLAMLQLNKVGNGGLAFEFLIENGEQNNGSSSPIHLKTPRFNSNKRNSLNNSSTPNEKLRDSYDSSCSTCNNNSNYSNSITQNFLKQNINRTNSDNQSSNVSVIESPKSGLSLGARIQMKAKENNINCINSSSPIKKQPPNDTSDLHYTNRALLLRQMSSKAKLENSNKKANSNKANTLTSKTLSSRNKSTSNSVANSRTNSRTSSPFGFHNNKSNTNNLMTNSLNLQNGLQLPSSSISNNNTASDLFKRRKNYDPLKSVEKEKLNKKKQHQSQSARSSSVSQDNKNNSDESIDNLGGKSSRISIGTSNKMSESMNSILSSNNDVTSIISDSSYNNNFTLQIKQLASNLSRNSRHHQQQQPEQLNYEGILESTLQRLCIRLIQISTAVLDKIGEDSSLLNNASYTSELERMQQLAKLVNSMQLVNDHVQIIDSTLFGRNSSSLKKTQEDSYLKELTRIRKEVDNLKQKASVNTSSNSSILNNKESVK